MKGQLTAVSLLFAGCTLMLFGMAHLVMMVNGADAADATHSVADVATVAGNAGDTPAVSRSGQVEVTLRLTPRPPRLRALAPKLAAVDTGVPTRANVQPRSTASDQPELTRLNPDTPMPATVKVVEIPVRIVISAIGLDAPVIPVSLSAPDETRETAQWQVPDYRAVGWHSTSARLGRSGNVVLSGHHNIRGRVFEHLKDVKLGNQITVIGQRHTVVYIVTERKVLREKDQPLAVRAAHARLIAPTQDDRLTLVTCWPANNNTHRLVVIAEKAWDTVKTTVGPR